MTRGKQIHWTEEQTAYCINAYATGKSTRDLAKEFCVCYQVIASLLKKNGVYLSSSRFISAKTRGRPSPIKGMKLSAETRERIRIASLKRKPHYGYRFTDEQKKRMSEARKRYFATTPKHLRTPIVRKKKLLDTERIAINHLRNCIKRMVRRVLTMARKRKDARSEKIIGYTKSELRAHIEAQFKDGMSWENRSSFHIDHKYPVAAFFRDGITDPKIINALSNLQVLTPRENQSKSDSIAPALRRMNLTIDATGTRNGIA